jgi:hypothetical protein
VSSNTLGRGLLIRNLAFGNPGVPGRGGESVDAAASTIFKLSTFSGTSRNFLVYFL